MSSRVSSLGTWLRSLGAALLFGGATTFLVQGWTDVGVLARELSWAALTLALSVFGIVAVRRLNDPKGARVGLALAAATIPLHFAEIGGGVWSYLHDGVGSAGALIGATAILLLLLPLLSLGVAALVRGRGAAFTVCLYLLSAALLVPTRNGDVIAAMVVVEVLLIALLELFVWRRDARLDTLEAAAARCLLLVPVAVLLLRNAYYPDTEAWLAALLFFPSAIACAVPFVARIGARTSAWLEGMGVFGMTFSLLFAFDVTPFSAVVASAVLSLLALGSRHNAGLYAWSGVTTLAACAVVGWHSPDIAFTLALVPAGVVHAVVAFQRRSLGAVVAAPLATVGGLAGQIAMHVRWPAENAWMIAAGFGVLLLVVASLVESRQSALARLWSHLSRHFAEEG